jgi:hypothetical protein
MRSLLLALCVCGCALAGPIKGPTEITVGVGRLEAVPLEVDGDEITYAILGGDYFGGFREFSEPKIFRFQVLGYANGTGYIVIGTQKGGKLQPLHTVKVTVGKGPQPIPPTPDPVPIDPDSPEVIALANKIASAATFDKWHPDNLKALASGHRQAAETISPDTVQKVRDAIQAKLKLSLSGQQISPTVKPFLKESLDAVFPDRAPTYQVTESELKAIKTRLETIAKALERAAK